MTALLTEPVAFVTLTALLGLVAGSFLNVVIHRVPRMMEREWQAQAAEVRGEEFDPGPRYNLMAPASHCPSCGHRIGVLENIPLLSYVLQRGKCRHCAAPISARYPLVELLTALFSALTAHLFGPSLATAAGLVFVWALVALTFIDLDTQLLPDGITQPLLWVGLVVNLGAVFVDLQGAVVGAVAGYLILWLVYWGFKLATGKEGMGYGDFKLLAAIGAWLGWPMLPLVILLAAGCGAIGGIVLIALGRHGRGRPMAFGPWLAMAGLIALWWGPQLNAAYLHIL